MKRIISILVLSIFMVSGAYARQNADNTNTPETKEVSTVVDSAEATSHASDAVKGESAIATSSKSAGENKSSQSSFLTMIALLVSIVSLALAVVGIVFSWKRYEKLHGRYCKLKDDLETMKYDMKEDISRRIDSNVATLDDKINAVKEQLEELRAVQTSKSECADIKPEVVAKPESPRFVSKTFFGIYKPKAKGVYIDQLTDTRDGGSTFEIETISDTEAIVHLVDNLSKTQFSGLMGDAVNVTEGSNPQSYDVISEVEAGRMSLNEETWTITKKILVKLS